MRAFYQGKIDNFCAIYAVLNAVQVLFGLSPFEARKIFNRTLMEHSRDPENFQKILEHRTDYLNLVDGMLDDIRAHEFPQLAVEAPFGSEASYQEVWEALRCSAERSLPRISIFRFLRIIPPSEKPYVDHWTVGHYMDTEGLHFLDCTLEAGALYSLPYARVTDIDKPLRREYVVIAPESVRILSVSRNQGLKALPV